MRRHQQTSGGLDHTELALAPFRGRSLCRLSIRAREQPPVPYFSMASPRNASTRVVSK